MTPFTTALGCVLALMVGQDPSTSMADHGDYQRMTIQNGTHRSVFYFPNSTGEADAVRELQRAENEALLGQDVQALRSEYINGERALEPIRRAVQKRLYGVNRTTNNGFTSFSSSFSPSYPISSFTSLTSPTFTSGFPMGNGLMGNPNLMAGAVSRSGNPAAGMGMGAGTFMPSGGSPVGGGSFGGSNGFFNPRGIGGLGALAGTGLGSLFGGGGGFNPYFSLFGNRAGSTTTGSRTTNYSLANGMGDEGRIKTAFASAMAAQLSPSYQDQVNARLQVARAAVNHQWPYVAVTLKNGEKDRGWLVQQNANWLVIRDGTEEHYLRFADIARMTKRIPSATTARSHGR